MNVCVVRFQIQVSGTTDDDERLDRAHACAERAADAVPVATESGIDIEIWRLEMAGVAAEPEMAKSSNDFWHARFDCCC